MSPQIQRLRRKFTPRGFITFLVFLVFAGIVAITLSLASEEPPACTWHEAIDSGINNFLEKDPPAPVEDVPFFDRNGDEVRLSDYKGTPLVMNFWATWCPPCVAEMPALDRLKGLLADSGIDVLAIDEDRNGAEMATKFYEANDIANLDILVDRKMALAKAAGVSGLPTTLFIDADGNEIGAAVGEAEWDSPKAVAFVKACLAPEN